MVTITHLMLRLVLFSPLLVLTAGAQTISLEGVVEDTDGRAVDRARVTLASDSSEYRDRITTTDTSGHFAFAEAAYGNYFVYAKKEESGFPDPIFAFFVIGQPKPMRVAVQGTASPLIVKVGKPDGFLSCTVSDQTGKPIPGAQYRLYPVENPQQLIISGADKEGKIHTPVPGVPIILQMEAAGYQLWRSDPMLITEGETKLLSIKLMPLAKNH
jgi:hypothetical protein